jgi:queuosine precursor transporter
MKSYRYLDLIIGLFVSVLLISNIAAGAKITTFGPFVFDAGTIIFPLCYIFSDILTEVYGYAVSRRVTWIGFVALALMAVTFALVGALPAEPEWLGADGFGQAAYGKILGSTPRIVIASLVAFWLGSFANDMILARLKVLTGGRRLWTRTIGSTLIGELIDSAIFVLVAFVGVLPASLLLTIALSNYVFKVLTEIALTPLTYAAVGWLKRREQTDHYDVDTNFNPFAV